MADEHLFITPDNPYLICDDCGDSVAQIHDAMLCGCDQQSFNKKCGHIGVLSTCPTWGVEGPKCICETEGVQHTE